MASSPVLVYCLAGVAAVVLAAGLLGAWARWVRRRGAPTNAVRLLGAYSPVLTWLRRRRTGVGGPAGALPPDPPAGEWFDRPLPAFRLERLAQVPPAPVLLAGGVLLAAANTLVQNAPGVPDDLRAASGLLRLAGLALALGALVALRQRWPPQLARLGDWLGVRPGQLAALALAPLLAAATTTISAGNSTISPAPVLANTLWLAALAAVVFGGWRAEAAAPRARWLVVLWVATLTAAALGLRAVAVGQIPVTLTGDEGSAGLDGVRFVQGQLNNLFAGAWHGFPTFYFAVQSIGVAFLGNTLEAIRWPSALAGALTVGGLYLLGRSMFGHRTGLFAALLLLGAHLHQHFSRIALNNVWDGLAYVLTLGALWVAWTRERRNAYLLAGLALGLSMYFYPSARSLAAVVPAWLAVAGWLDRPRLKRALPHLALFALTAAVTTLPLAYYYLRYPDEFFGPMRAASFIGPILDATVQQTGQPAWLVLLIQVWRGLEGFTFLPLQNWYRPEVPLLRLPQAVFFWLALAWLAWRRDARLWLLGLWLLAFGFVGGWSESTPAAQRYVAATPLAALLVGYGVNAGLTQLARWLRAPAGWAPVVGLALVLGLTVDDLRFYYFEYTPESHYLGARDFEGIGAATAEFLADYLRGQPSDWQVAFFGGGRMGFYSIPSLQYLAPGFVGWDFNYPWGDARNPPLPAGRVIFAVLGDLLTDLAAIQAQYPGGLLVSATSTQGFPYLYVYQVPAPEAAAALLERAATSSAGLPVDPTLPMMLAAVLAVSLFAGLAGVVGWSNILPDEPEEGLRLAPPARPAPAVPVQLPAESPPPAPPAPAAQEPAVSAPAPPAMQEPAPAAPPPALEAGPALAMPTEAAAAGAPAAEPGRVRVTVEVPAGMTVRLTIETRLDGAAPRIEQTVVAPEAGQRGPQPVFAAGPSWFRRPLTWPAWLAWLRRWEWALFAGGLAVYLLTHLVGLEQFPIYFHTDEALQSLRAAEFVNNGWRDASGEFFPTFFTNGPFYNLGVSVYLQVIPHLLFGFSETVTRGVPALLAGLAAAAIGLFLRHGSKAPHWWAGPLWLSTAPAWFLHARTGFETVVMATFYAALLYFYLLYRLRSPRWLYAALVAGALAFYSYSPGQLVVLATAVLLLVVDARYHWQQRAVVARGLALAAVLAAPYVRFQINHPTASYFQLRERGSFLVDPNVPLGEKVSRVAGEYVFGLNPAYWFWDSDRDIERHRLGPYSHLLTATLPLAALGLGLALRGWRAPPNRIILAALLAAPLGGAVAEVGITRVLAFIVPATLLIGLGASAALAWLERFRLPPRSAALGLFVILAGFNLYLWREALTAGGTWSRNYGLYGMQYGGRQLFGDAIPAYLDSHPEVELMVSPNWANAADLFIRFFVPPAQQARVQMRDVNYYLFQPRPLPPGTVLVMTLQEYDVARASPKLADVQADLTVPYPDGTPGFYFTRLRYSDQAAALFEAEAAERRRPVEETLEVDGQAVTVSHSRFDIGQLRNVFDGDTFTLARGQEANPLVLDLRFDSARPVTGLSLTTGSMADYTVFARLYGADGALSHEYAQDFRGQPPDPTVTLAFPDAPPAVSRLVVEVKDNLAGEMTNIHIREIGLRK